LDASYRPSLETSGRRRCMSKQFNGKRVAILATDGFEQAELTEPKRNLEKAGAKVTVLSVAKTPKEIKGWDKTDWGNKVKVDALVASWAVDTD
jgi:protease I